MRGEQVECGSAQLKTVVDRLSELYTPEEARLWLHAGHPLLGGARPIDLVNADRTAEILAAIEAVDSGVYI